MADKAFVEEFMEATNAYRKRHQVGNLTLNKDISKISQEWANKLVKANSMSHNKNPKYKGAQLGENIAMRFDSTQAYYSGHHAVGQWYKEIENYDFNTHKGHSTGHFTQLVWKESREVGVGRAQAPDGKWIVVANYYPAGNIIGHHEANVLPSIDGDTSILRSSKDQISVDAHKERTTYPDSSKGGQRTSRAGRVHGATVSTTIVRKIIKKGSDVLIEETTTTTRVSTDGKTTVSTQKVIRPATAEELKKYKMT